MPYKNRAPFPSAAFVESQRNFTYFDKSLTSGLSDVTIESPGDFLYIDQASTGYVYIELNQRQSGTLAPILLAAGGSIECDFASVKLYAPAQLNKSVRIVVGNGARIKGGANVNASSMSVSVVDGGRQRTAANAAFSSFIEQVAVAGQYSHVQLYNPAGTGKNLIVEQIMVSSQTAAGFVIRQYDVAIANAYGYLTPVSKKLAGAGSVAQQRIEANAGIFGATAYMWGANLAANSPVVVKLAEPIAIAPTQGLLVLCTTINVRFSAAFEYYEE